MKKIEMNIKITIDPMTKDTIFNIDNEDVNTCYNLSGLELLKQIIDRLEHHINREKSYKHLDDDSKYINDAIYSLNKIGLEATNLNRW